MRVGYSAEDVAKLIGVSVRQVHSYVRDGFLAPAVGDDGRPRFSFQDVVLLRTAAGLTAARIAPARVKRALARLKQQLPEGRPLTGVAIAAEGNRIIVRDGGARWNPESGQVLFDFRVAELADGIAELKPKAPPPPATDAIEAAAGRRVVSDRLRPRGRGRQRRRHRRLSARHRDRRRARRRVRQPRAPDARARRHARRRCKRTRRRCSCGPDDALAAFNLGVTLEDAGGSTTRRRRISAPSTPIRAPPTRTTTSPGVFERLGDRAAALRHLRTYKKLTGK